MNEPTPLDRIRDLLDGRLAPAEVEALRADIAGDADLRADFEAFRAVHEITRAEPAGPVSRLTADDVLRADAGHPVAARGPRIRPWMAAAAVLVAVAAGVAASLSRSAPREIALGALFAPADVARSEPATRDDAPSVPANLADYAPVEGGAPHWFATWDEAAAVARAASKPIFAFVYFKDCPYCQELDAKTFADAAVQSDLAQFVPVRIDVTKLAESDPLMARLARGWPYLAALRADGSEIHELAGRWELPEVAPEMRRAVEESRRAEPTQPSWDAVRAAAKSVRAAESALAGGRAGEAWTDAARAATEAPSSGIAARAVRLQADVRALAQRALSDAAAGRADVATLERAAANLAGSPFGDDLAAVARAVRETGVFPVLTSAGGHR